MEKHIIYIMLFWDRVGLGLFSDVTSDMVRCANSEKGARLVLLFAKRRQLFLYDIMQYIIEHTVSFRFFSV